MFLVDLFEENSSIQNLLVIYPGRFQPWHKGHQQVFDYLQRKFGRDIVWVATSNKVAPPKSPFSFSDKLKFMAQTGVHADRIVETQNPYRVPELVERYNPDATVLIFAVSAKDMAEDPRFKMGTKKDGSPSYFQPAPDNLKECMPLSKHGYIMTVPTFKFNLLGKPIQSASEIRAMYAAADEQQKKAIITELFGSYSKELQEIFDTKLVTTVTEDAAGVGVIAKNKRMAKDPRYSMSITQDVKYNTMNKNLRAFNLIETQVDDRILMRLAPDFDKFVPMTIKEKVSALLNDSPSIEFVELHDAYLVPRHIFYKLQDIRQLAPYLETVVTAGSTYNEDITDFNRQDPMNSRVAPAGGVGSMPLRDWKKYLTKKIKELEQEISGAMDPALIDRKMIWDRVGQLLSPDGSIVNIAREIVAAHHDLEQQRQKGGILSKNIGKE